jgi:hypothetical protein
MARFSPQALKAARQHKVQQLVLRGLTQREIVAALEKQRVINPQTGKPWSLGTINADLKELEAHWEQAALEERCKKKARVNQELQELKRAAWTEKNLALVADLIKQERQLFNLDEPITVNHQLGGNVDVTHQLAAGPDLTGMEPDEVDVLIQNLLLAAGVQNTPVVIEGEFFEVGGMDE